MAIEVNAGEIMTESDKRNLFAALAIVRSHLDSAWMEYYETETPADCTKPHIIVPLIDPRTGNVDTLVNLFVSGRSENGDVDPINTAKILNIQRDGFLSAGMQDQINIVEAACFPFLTKERNNLHPLNQSPNNTLYAEQFGEMQVGTLAISDVIQGWVQDYHEQQAERNPYCQPVTGITFSDAETFFREYYAAENIVLPGKTGEKQVIEDIRKLPDGEAVFMAPFCMDDSNVCDILLFIKGYGFIVVEVKNWRSIDHIDKRRVQLGDGVERANPDAQLNRYQKYLIQKYLQKYPYYAEDAAKKHIKSVIWFPNLERSEEIVQNLASPAIFKDEGCDPIELLENLKSLFAGGATLTGTENLEYLRMLDPSIKYATPIDGVYSHLRVWDNDPFSVDNAKRIVAEWYSGTKQIHFVKSTAELELLRGQLKTFFAEHPVRVDDHDPFALILSDSDITSESATAQALSHPNHIALFNLEAYVLPADEFAALEVIDGRNLTDAGRAELLEIQNALLEAVSSEDTGGVFSFEQYEAEHSPSEINVAVKAGAGTGKTYLMVMRLAFLLSRQSGANIHDLVKQIIMLTFTNNAADTMRQRIKKMLNSYFVLTGNQIYLICMEQISQMQICTIDAFVKSLIQDNPTAIGVGSDFDVTTSTYKFKQILREKVASRFVSLPAHDIYDSNVVDAILEIGEAILKKGVDVTACDFHFPDATYCSNAMRSIINWLYTADAFGRTNLAGMIADAQAEFAEYLKERNQVMLSQFTRTAMQCVHSSDFNPYFFDLHTMFIDEYQDTNVDQIMLVKALQERLGFKLFVVGDVKQSIYGFRDAVEDAFDRMMQGVELWNTYCLTINRRSTKCVIDVTNQVCGYIHQTNPWQLSMFGELALLSGIKQEDSKIEVIPLPSSPNPEAVQAFVTEVRDTIEANPEKLGKIAILARSNRIVQSIANAPGAKELNIEAIADNNEGDFYTQPPVLDLYFFLAALTHPKQPEYLFALLMTNLFRAAQEQPNESMQIPSTSGIRTDAEDLLTLLIGIATEQSDPTRMLQEFLNGGNEKFRSLLDNAQNYLAKQASMNYVPFYPDTLGDNPLAALTAIINGCLAKYQPEQPYLQNWDALCRETSNAGNATSLLKIIHDLFLLAQPWCNYSGIRREEYIANYKLLFEEIARFYCQKEMTLDRIFEALKLKIMSHEKKESALVAERSETIKCMTIHKAKGLEFDTVFLFAGNSSDSIYSGNQCKIRRSGDRSIVDVKLSLNHMYSYIMANDKRVYLEEITTPGMYETDQNEEWRVLYVALTRAKRNLFVSYIDRNDGKQNQWNAVLNHIRTREE